VDAGGGNIGFLALVNSNYVTAENNGASPLIANRTAVGSWETFTEFDAGGGNIGLRAMNDGKYVTAPNGGASPLIAQSTNIGAAESFLVGLVGGIPPTAPADVIASAGNARASLSWLPSAGAVGYNVKRATASGGPYSIVSTNQVGPGYVDTGLVNGTTYYYVISALNAVGESGNSSQVYAMPGTLGRTIWVASSSTTGGDQPDNALDGDLSTRWSTGTSQVNGQWFQVDMGTINVFNKLVLNSDNSGNDFPRGYQVLVSNDGVNWTGPVASGAGSYGTTTINFATQAARYIRIIQTGSVSGTFWSIHEFNVFGAAPFTPTSLAASAVASGRVDLSWNGSEGATGYNLKRTATSGTGYAMIGTNLPATAYIDAGLSNGVTYFYVVSATNAFGESANSAEAHAQPVSMISLPVNVAVNGGRMQLTWPADHLGWRLEVQTNSLSEVGWITVPNSTVTNQISVLIQPDNNVFFRLVFP
jgi:fibronectin type 3 domain-containing protein